MKENNIGNTIMGSFFWKFGERLMTQGVSFVVSLVLARLLSPDDYGIIALVMVFINLAGVFITSGFATALIQKKDVDSTDYSTIFYLSLGCSIIIYFVLYACAPFIARFYDQPALSPVLRVFALQVPLSVYNSVQMAYVSRNMLFRKVFVSATVAAVASGVVGIGMAFAGLGVWALVANSITTVVVSSIVLTFMIPWRPCLKFSKGSAKSMMKYGSQVLAADLSGTFFNEVRSLIIGRVYSGADLAFYNKGYQLPTLITTNLSNTLMTVMFPAFANQSKDLNVVKQMARRSMKLLSFVLVPCLFGLAAVMRPLILLLYTEKWAASIPYGQILSIGLCIGVLGVIPLQVFKAIGRSDVLLGLEVYKKPMYVILLVIGVSINVFGIAVTMVIYECYGMLVNMVQLKKHIHYDLWEVFRDLMPAFLLGAAMALTVLLMPTFNSLFATLVLKVIAGVVVYIGGAILFKVESFTYLKDVLIGSLRR